MSDDDFEIFAADDEFSNRFEKRSIFDLYFYDTHAHENQNNRETFEHAAVMGSSRKFEARFFVAVRVIRMRVIVPTLYKTFEIRRRRLFCTLPK